MKTRLFSLVILPILLLVSFSLNTHFAFSQDASKEKKISKSLEKTQKNMNLTDEQTNQVKAIREEAARQRKEAKGKPNQKELVKAINKDANAKVQALLSPEQKADMKEKAKEKRKIAKEKKATKDASTKKVE
jgi:Spy/CpxP family protein refolding chaperone